MSPSRHCQEGDSPHSGGERRARPKGDCPLLVGELPGLGEVIGRIEGAFVLGADGVFAVRDIELDGGLVAAPGSSSDGPQVSAPGCG